MDDDGDDGRKSPKNIIQGDLPPALSAKGRTATSPDVSSLLANARIHLSVSCRRPTDVQRVERNTHYYAA